MRLFRKITKMFMLALVYSMIGVFGAITLPTNPSVSSATVGKDYLLSINTGTVGSPTWTLIGGQRGASLARKADEVDVSNKTTSGWKATKAGLRSWSIDLDGLVLLQDDGISALDYAFMNGLEINIKLEYPDKSSRTGWGSLTDFSHEAPHDGEATLKGTISGNGAITDRTPNIAPASVTVSKASATDQTFAILPTTATITSIKNAGTALTITTHYTYAAGALVVKAAYFSSLTTGTQRLDILTGDGTTMTVTVVLNA